MSEGVEIELEIFSRRTKKWFPSKSQQQDPDHIQNSGGGFQVYDVCNNGLKYTFHFQDDPALKKYIGQSSSDLHAQVLEIFYNIEHNYHRDWMYHLYNSANFSRMHETIQNVSWCR